MPFPEVATTIACFELAFRLSRIITPAFAQELVLVMLATRATMVQSPSSC